MVGSALGGRAGRGTGGRSTVTLCTNRSAVSESSSVLAARLASSCCCSAVWLCVAGSKGVQQPKAVGKQQALSAQDASSRGPHLLQAASHWLRLGWEAWERCRPGREKVRERRQDDVLQAASKII